MVELSELIEQVQLAAFSGTAHEWYASEEGRGEVLAALLKLGTVQQERVDAELAAERERQRAEVFERRCFAVESRLGTLQLELDAAKRERDTVALVGGKSLTELHSALGRLRTLAIGIVGARMAHVEKDYAEAYHLLYHAAAALSDDRLDAWKGVEALSAGAIERRDGQTFVNLEPAVERNESQSSRPTRN